MTERQKKFVDEYILNGGNATAAAKAAGYSAKTAYSIAERLLKNVEIRAEIDKRIDAARSANTAKQSELLSFLSDVVRGVICDEMLMTRLTGKGTSVIERHEVRASLKERIRAAEMLLKVFGAFREQQADSSASVDKFIETLEKIERDESAD